MQTCSYFSITTCLFFVEKQSREILSPSHFIFYHYVKFYSIEKEHSLQISLLFLFPFLFLFCFLSRLYSGTGQKNACYVFLKLLSSLIYEGVWDHVGVCGRLLSMTCVGVLESLSMQLQVMDSAWFLLSCIYSEVCSSYLKDNSSVLPLAFDRLSDSNEAIGR